MNKYSILFIGFFLISYCTFGQKNHVYNYYKYVNKAELARDLSKNKKAIQTFTDGGYGFASITPMMFSSAEEENESIKELIRQIDFGEVKGKYIKGERHPFTQF